ncbi:hypothetical protein HMPREF0083_06238 [Aneurinibacillus aneurinilyticus ATCC 12856]|uniref:Uncharacterized protein n=1 Tax=Aneurinibacillus aneurinilyticus ATCC 12856 TaxID=649747 RepID=U1WMT8_ANEAE|nr:hypothetical protein HMPREF0083_06238 [Aneurinibacillus aneurinilyticus ATCC 12856]
MNTITDFTIQPPYNKAVQDDIKKEEVPEGFKTSPYHTSVVWGPFFKKNYFTFGVKLYART